jgi:hypothetical protein
LPGRQAEVVDKHIGDAVDLFGELGIGPARRRRDQRRLVAPSFRDIAVEKLARAIQPLGIAEPVEVDELGPHLLRGKIVLGEGVEMR